MKLIQCHIENFGKFSDRTIEFGPNCNTICEQNGWGKSTLAAFIRVMFFGFGGEGKRDELENERKRYHPWQRGVYGGQITFETNGKRYVISRTFGSKEKEDTFEVRDADKNLVVDTFTEAIGQELFQIDRDSFLRTVFLSQNDCETSSTAGIDAKIGNLAQTSDDLNNYENASEKIAQLMNSLTPKRITGKCKQLEGEISDLNSFVLRREVTEQEVDKLLAGLTTCRERVSDLEQKQEQLRREQSEISDAQDAKTAIGLYDKLQQEEQARKQKVTEAGSRFPGVIPDAETLEAVLRDSGEINARETALSLNPFTEEDEKKLDILTQQFVTGCPTEAETEKAEQIFGEYQNLSVASAGRQISIAQRDRWKKLVKMFPQGTVEDEIINDQISKWNARTEKENRLTGKQTNYETLQSIERQKDLEFGKQVKSARQIKLALMGIGILLLIAGIIVFLLKMVWGIPVAVLGLILGLAGMLKKVPTENKELNVTRSELRRLQEELEADENDIRDKESQVMEFLSAFGVEPQEYNVLDLLYSLKTAGKEYEELKLKIQEADDEESKARLVACKDYLNSYTARYDHNQEEEIGAYSLSLKRIRENASAYERLKKAKAENSRCRRALEEVTEHVTAYLKGLNMIPQQDMVEQLQHIKTDLQELKNCESEYGAVKAQKAQFEAQQDIDRLLQARDKLASMRTLEEVDTQFGALGQELEQARREQQQLENRLESAEEDLEEILKAQERLEDKKEELAQAKTKFKHLEMTQTLLREAKESFTSAYMEPMNTAFRKYSSMITDGDASRYRFDANTNLSVEEAGGQRDPRFFSAGYRDYLGLCMRMAMVDSMYREEKPFIVMDDPFVNLDDEKTEGAKEFLRKVSEEYQIIYFTCHTSLTV